jgi:ankyrin repeat protein
MFPYIKYLVELGLDSNARDEKERTPLSYASAKRYTNIVSLLLEHLSGMFNALSYLTDS